jgi:ATP-dependent DNA helicase RecG
MSDLDKAIKTLNGANKGVIEGVKKVINKGVSDGVIDGISDGVKEEIASIVYLIANNEGINANNIVAKTGNKSKPSVERYLKIAKNLEIIEFKGAAKTGGYYLTGKIKSDVR